MTSTHSHKPFASGRTLYSLCLSTALAALVVPAGSLVVPSSMAVSYAADIVLENIIIEDKGQTTTFKRIEATDTNLDKEELAKLFNPATKSEDAAAILRKMKAAKLTIPTLTVSSKDFAGTVRDIVATDVNQGKLAKLTVAGFEGTNPPGGKPVSVSVGPAQVENADLSTLLDAARNKVEIEPNMLNHAVGHVLVKDVDIKAEANGGTPEKPVGQNHIHIASLEGTADPSVLPKERGIFEIKNFLFEPAKGSSDAAPFTQMGYDKVDIGMKIVGSFDEAGKKMVIEDWTIAGVDMGALTLRADVGNYVKPSKKSPDASKQALMSAEFNSIQLTFANSGLFEKVVTLTAKEEGKTPDALKAEWSAIATAMLPALLSGDPAGTTIGAAVSQFIANPKNVTIGASAKAAPLKIGDFEKAKSPQDILSKITVTATANK